MIKRHAFLLSLAVVASCAKPPRPQPPKAEYQGPDLDARRLPADEEINLLLAGTPVVTSSKGTARIAVPPLTVLGAPEKSWMGEAVAELVSAGLANRPQVSVLERGQLSKLIDEIDRSKGNGSAATNQTGKLLGAQYLVLGKLIPEGDHVLAVLSPVRVEDGVKLAGVTVALEGDDIAAAIAPAVQGLADSLLGKIDNPPPLPPSLGPEALQLVSKARRLQNTGKPLDAQPLFAKALPALSSSWRVEADYLRLMTDLGLNDWVKDRATKLLARMPSTQEAMCDRARLSILQNTTRTVNGAREALRTAGVCGDDAVVALALVHYGLSLRSVDFDAARTAFTRALALKAGKESGWVRCVATEELYLLESEEGGDWKGSRREHYEANAKICADVGNARSESIALQNAAYYAETPGDRVLLYKRAIDVARKVGGMRLHEAVVHAAEQLREQGKPTEADAQLLELLGIAVNRVAAAYGGLPTEAVGIDDELLARAKVKRPAVVTKEPTGASALIARAARLQLARALQAWAERTRDSSSRQADAYFAIVEKLDPPPPVDKSAPSDPFEAALAKAKLPLTKIKSAAEPPARGAPDDAESAFYAIEEQFHTLRDDKAPATELRDLIDAAKKTSGWVGSPRLARLAMLLEANVEADLGHADAALSIARSTLTLIKDDPEWRIRVLDLEIEVLEQTKPAEAYKAALERAELAKRISAAEFEIRSYNAAYIGWETKQLPLDDALARHSKLADDSAAKGDFVVAAAALAHVGRLHKMGSHVDGSEVAVRAFERRVGYLDKVGDPLLSASARIELLKEIANEAYARLGLMKARATLAADKGVLAGMADVRKRLDELVGAGRARDAARLAAMLSRDLPGVYKILREGLSWAKTFEDSAEYPVLVAGLYATLGDLEPTFEGQRDSYAKARDLYESVKDYDNALSMQENLFYLASSETEAWSTYARCRKLTADGKIASAPCTAGIAAFAVFGGRGGYSELLEKPHLSDANLLREAVQDGLLALPWVEKNWNPLSRERYRVNVAVLAASAKDYLTFERLADETRTYFMKTEPTPSEWRVRLGDIVTVLSGIDRKRALKAAHELTTLPGTTDYWRASRYWRYASIAREVGDTAAEKMFVDEGRAATAKNPRYAPNYDLYSVPAAKLAGNYAAMTSAFVAAAATVRKLNPDYRVRVWQLEVAAAQSKLLGGDAKGALASLKLATAEMAKQDQPEAPCFESFANELAAAAANASKTCSAAATYLARAKTLRGMCATKTIEEPTWSVSWIDGKEYTAFRAPACGTTASAKDLESTWP